MHHTRQTAYTIKHVLIKYIDLAPIRERFYDARLTKELLKNKVAAIMFILNLKTELIKI